jgi:DNA-binding XRE family transcriptional regulator
MPVSTVSYEEVKARLLKDTDFEEEYLRMEPYYQLLRLRLSQGLTQAELANKSQVQQSVIARIERGKGNPTLETLQRIAKALDARVTIGLK